jgi:hypothetical protein
VAGGMSLKLECRSYTGGINSEFVFGINWESTNRSVGTWRSRFYLSLSLHMEVPHSAGPPFQATLPSLRNGAGQRF